MNHVSAIAAIDRLFAGDARARGELRAHLDGCLECRAHYDRTARTFRALAGHPDEMTEEEQWLFAPVYPDQPSRGRWPVLLFGGLLTAATAALVLFVREDTAAEFAARGNQPVAEQPALRAFCARGDGAGSVVGEPSSGNCQSGDRLLFSVTPRGRKFLGLAVIDDGKIERVVSGPAGELAAEAEVVLTYTSTWRPGLRAAAIYSEAPIDAAALERCAGGDCPDRLERVLVPLGPAEQK